MTWDSGRTLGVVIGHDQFRIIDDEGERAEQALDALERGEATVKRIDGGD